ncbi:hypothetical protein C8Q75DRAFT_319588 [Abortiporus biennis]|nr:hypothetical protein C8Q75DRAFT_319588 [Abortiporus biennis]
MPASQLFDKLPVELITLIKGSIPKSDLRTHVCFYQTCQMIADLYRSPGDDTEDSFWESACILSGLGCLPHEYPSEVSWKTVAFDLIKNDGFCDHPHCGGTRLEDNASRMSEYVSDNVSWQTLHIRKSSDDFENITENSILGDVAFLDKAPQVSAKPQVSDYSVDRDAQLCFLDSIEHKSPLSDHPITQRSFATFPPVSAAVLTCPLNLPFLRHIHGITVWDVQNAFRSILDEELLASRVSSLVDYVDYEKAFPVGCDLSLVLKEFWTLRSFMKYFHIDSIKLEHWDGGPPSFRVHFKVVRTMSVTGKAR